MFQIKSIFLMIFYEDNGQNLKTMLHFTQMKNIWRLPYFTIILEILPWNPNKTCRSFVKPTSNVCVCIQYKPEKNSWNLQTTFFKELKIRPKLWISCKISSKATIFLNSTRIFRPICVARINDEKQSRDEYSRKAKKQILIYNIVLSLQKGWRRSLLHNQKIPFIISMSVLAETSLSS